MSAAARMLAKLLPAAINVAIVEEHDELSPEQREALYRKNILDERAVVNDARNVERRAAFETVKGLWPCFGPPTWMGPFRRRVAALELQIEVPIDDMAVANAMENIAEGLLEEISRGNRRAAEKTAAPGATVHQLPAKKKARP